MLVLVIFLLVLFSLAGVALLRMTVTEGKVTDSFRTNSETVRRVDSALQTAVNEIRSNPKNVLQDDKSFDDANYYSCSGTGFEFGTMHTAFPDYIGACVALASDPPTGRRDLKISLTTSDGTLVGQARVVISDRLTSGGPAVLGYHMTVCDWQVAAALSSTTNSCS